MKTQLWIAVGCLSTFMLMGCATYKCSTCVQQRTYSRSCDTVKTNACDCADIACTYYGYDCLDRAKCCRVFGNIGTLYDSSDDSDDVDYSDAAPESAFSTYAVETQPAYTTRPVHYKGEV